MGRSRRRSVFAVLIVVALTVVAAGCGGGSETATGTNAGSPSDSLASLQVLSTDVTVQPAGANPTPGASGQGLNQGDEVSTDPNGFAEIGFTDGSLARVDNNAQFVLTALTHQDAVTATHTQLLNGDSWHHVQPLADQGDLYQVDTPVASATVRGTQFAINCTAGTTCTYAVVEGTVQLALPDGTTLTLTAGQKITLIKDLPPPKIDTPGIPQLEQDPWIAQNLALDAPNNPPGTTPAAGPLAGRPLHAHRHRGVSHAGSLTDAATGLISPSTATASTSSTSEEHRPAGPETLRNVPVTIDQRLVHDPRQVPHRQPTRRHHRDTGRDTANLHLGVHAYGHQLRWRQTRSPPAGRTRTRPANRP